MPHKKLELQSFQNMQTRVLGEGCQQRLHLCVCVCVCMYVCVFFLSEGSYLGSGFGMCAWGLYRGARVEDNNEKTTIFCKKLSFFVVLSSFSSFCRRFLCFH